MKKLFVILLLFVLVSNVHAISKTLYPTADGYIYSGEGGGGNGTNTELRIGYNSTYGTYFSALKFDITSNIPSNATITSANLNVYYYDAWDAFHTRTVHAFRAINSWSESNMTWNQPTGDWSTWQSQQTVNGSNASLRKYTWNITNLVQNWHNNTWSNQGVLLSHSDDSSIIGRLRFYSRESSSYRPYLNVEYTLPIELVDSSCYISPASQEQGERITVYYRIYNPNSSSQTAGLGCSIKKVGTSTWINDTNDDKTVSVPSGYSTQSRYFDIPSSASTGAYIVGWGLWDAFPGTGNLVDDLERDDLTVTLKAPDLTISYLSPETINVIRGQSYTISTKVNNQGNDTAGTNKLGWYVSSNPSFHGAKIHETSISSLSSGSSTSTLSQDFAADFDDAVVYMFTRADVYNDVSESDENNNYSDDTLNPGYVTVIIGDPTYHDLQVTNISVDDPSPQPGQSVTVDFTIANNGTEAASSNAFTNSVRWSTNTSITLNDPEIGSKNMGGLSGGQSSSDSITVSIPSDAQPGTTYYIGVYTDSSDVVNEDDGTTSYEGNNTNYTTVGLISLPNVDLTLYRISDTSGTPNSSNPGTAKTVFQPGETVRITLCADNTGASADILTVLNIREPDDSTIFYDSHDSSTTDSGTVEDNTNDSPLTNSEGYDYYSFEKLIPIGATAGLYDIGGSIRNQGWTEVYDTTTSGRNDEDFSNAWILDQFSIAEVDIIEQLYGTPTLSENITLFGVDYTIYTLQKEGATLGEEILLPFIGLDPPAIEQNLVKDHELACLLFKSYSFNKQVGGLQSEIDDVLIPMRNHYALDSWWRTGMETVIPGMKLFSKRKVERYNIGHLSLWSANEIFKAKMTGGITAFSAIWTGLDVLNDLGHFDEYSSDEIRNEIQMLILAQAVYGGELDTLEALMLTANMPNIEDLVKLSQGLEQINNYTEAAYYLHEAKLAASVGNMSAETGFKYYRGEYVDSIKNLGIGLTIDLAEDWVFNGLLGWNTLDEEMQLAAWLNDAHCEGISAISKELINQAENIQIIQTSSDTPSNRAVLYPMYNQFLYTQGHMLWPLTAEHFGVQLVHLQRIKNHTDPATAWWIGARQSAINELEIDYEDCISLYVNDWKDNYESFLTEAPVLVAGYDGAMSAIGDQYSNNLLRVESPSNRSVYPNEVTVVSVPCKNDYAYPLEITSIGAGSHATGITFNSSDSEVIVAGGHGTIDINITVPVDWYTANSGSSQLAELIIPFTWEVNGNIYNKSFIIPVNVDSHGRFEHAIPNKSLYYPNEVADISVNYSGNIGTGTFVVVGTLLKPSGDAIALSFDEQNEGIAELAFYIPDGPYGAYALKVFLYEYLGDIVIPETYFNHVFYVVPNVQGDIDWIDKQNSIIIYPLADYEAAEEIQGVLGVPESSMYEIEQFAFEDLLALAQSHDTILLGGSQANPLVNDLKSRGEIIESLTQEGDAMVSVVQNAFASHTSAVIAGYRLSDTQTACISFLNLGSIQVDITPQEAVDNGALWRIDNQLPWYNSGDIVTFSVGTHTVTFTDIPGWTKPNAFDVSISTGQLIQETRAYTEVYGTPSAVITSISPSPADPQTDTVQFRENSSDNDEGGALITYWRWTSNLGDYQGNSILHQSSSSGDFDLAADDLQVGTHTITLYVEDDESDSDTTTETLTVSNVKPVIDSLDITQGAGDQFTITGTAHDRDEHQQSITGWHISITGPSYSNTLMAGPGSLNHVFDGSNLAVGTYSVSVVAIDDESVPSDPQTLNIMIDMLSCDIITDQIVNLLDFSEVGAWWMQTCSGSDWCGGTDFNRSGQTNINDLLHFADNWLMNTADPSLTLLLQEAISGYTTLRSCVISDINQDGQQELVIGATMSDGTSVVKVYSVSGTSLNELWSHSITDAPNNGIIGVCVGDVDNDGSSELAVHTATYTGGQIRIFEKGTGNTWTQVWSDSSKSDHSPDNLFVGDSDNDGLNELVVGKSYGDRQLAVYNHAGGNSYTKTVCSVSYTDYRSVWIGDLRNDGTNVILAGTSFWSNAPVMAIEYNDSSYSSIWSMSDSQQNSQETKGGNVDADSENEIIVSTNKGWGTMTAVRVYDYAGSNSWSQSWIYQEGNWNFYRAPEIGNLIPWNGCNEFFVPASDGSNHRLYMFDNYQGTYRVAWTENLSASVNDSCVGDVDNDGKDELVLLSGNSVIVYEY